ncbi:MAG TPA: DUF5996 family protein [Candidatus Dormibacteraeota bacterium]|nr:DUF5996 family protein [Candidatus Dormibacteraeota bacterium]
MGGPNGVRPELPALPLQEWEPARDTLHLWVQIVGKVRMASSAPRNHWWHVPLYVDVHGLTTRRLHSRAGITFQVDLDLLRHRLVASTGDGEEESFALETGLSVAAFDERLHAALRRLGVDVAIREVPYGVPWTTPFPEDHEHAAYDPDAARRFWRILDWSDTVFDEFSGWYCGKTSPVHFFWHSFDLAVTRFNGSRAPEMSGADFVTREAYSHEVVSFGFWVGDRQVREPSYYAYAAPEPADLRGQPLRPGDAHWIEQRGGSLAILPYESVRRSRDPSSTLLAFLQSAYQAGSLEAGWSRDDLVSTWCPGPPELTALLDGAAG